MKNVFWVSLYVFLGVGVSAILGMLLAVDDTIAKIAASIFIAVFIPFWSAIGLVIYLEMSGDERI